MLISIKANFENILSNYQNQDREKEVKNLKLAQNQHQRKNLKNNINFHSIQNYTINQN